MTQLSATLRSLRARDKLTQQELAEKTGLSRSRINNYEHGIREPDFQTAEILADFFNVDLTMLYSGSPSSVSLSESESTMLDFFRSLSSSGQKKVLEYALDLINSGRYSPENAKAPAEAGAGGLYE